MSDQATLDLFAAPPPDDTAFEQFVERALDEIALGLDPRADLHNPRPRDVTPTGPHRFILEPAPRDSDRRRLVDRRSGDVIDEGPWLNMWGLALRMNGLLVDGHPNA